MESSSSTADFIFPLLRRAIAAIGARGGETCLNIYMTIYVYLYMYVHVYVYMYVSVYIHTHIYTYGGTLGLALL
jgi:hypothetical protein